jgi:protein-disulfide isomerase
MKSESAGPRSVSTPAKSFDLSSFAIFVGVLVILGVSFVTMLRLNRLTERVNTLEAELAGRSAPARARTAEGPDPTVVHKVETAGAPSKGPETAPVTIVEFSEFECPFCKRVDPTLKQIEKVYGDKVRFVWKHLPLMSIHADAMNAALASEAARSQGKFWQYHDALFANQENLAVDDLKRYAKEVGLDLVRFEKDRLDPENRKKVEADVAEARSLKVSTTPSFFINGRFVRGAQPFDMFAKVIDEELAKANGLSPAKTSN